MLSRDENDRGRRSPLQSRFRSSGQRPFTYGNDNGVIVVTGKAESHIMSTSAIVKTIEQVLESGPLIWWLYYFRYL